MRKNTPIPAHVRSRTLGEDILKGDLLDLKSMRPLFCGIKRAYLTRQGAMASCR
jgi:hypothetical protein